MNIYNLLKNDHSRVLQILEQLQNLPKDSPQRHALVRKVRDELIPHARAEEAVLYNSLRTLNVDHIMDSYQEHIESEALLRTLQLKIKVDMEWQKTALHLKTSLESHIHDEESRLFGLCEQHFSYQESLMLAQAFQKMKAHVQKEGLMGTTIDLILNLMPPRLAEPLRAKPESHLTL